MVNVITKQVKELQRKVKKKVQEEVNFQQRVEAIQVSSTCVGSDKYDATFGSVYLPRSCKQGKL